MGGLGSGCSPDTWHFNINLFKISTVSRTPPAGFSSFGTIWFAVALIVATPCHSKCVFLLNRCFLDELLQTTSLEGGGRGPGPSRTAWTSTPTSGRGSSTRTRRHSWGSTSTAKRRRSWRGRTTAPSRTPTWTTSCDANTDPAPGHLATLYATKTHRLLSCVHVSLDCPAPPVHVTRHATFAIHMLLYFSVRRWLFVSNSLVHARTSKFRTGV